MLQGPSAAHDFGTDKFCRDIFSRVVWGCQRAMTIAVLAVVMGTLFGVPVGVISGYYGGKLDTIIMRVFDAWFAFPVILLFFLLAATLIRAYELSVFWSTVGLIVALGLARIPSMGWLVRGSMLAEREKDTTSRPLTPPASRICISPFARSCPTACRRSSCRPLLRWASSY